MRVVAPAAGSCMIYDRREGWGEKANKRTCPAGLFHISTLAVRCLAFLPWIYAMPSATRAQSYEQSHPPRASMAPAPARSQSPPGQEATNPSDRADNWLPLARPQSALANPNLLRRADIQAKKHRDWFLAFASLIETEDGNQSWMLVKAYHFLRDFMPRGLTGRWSHIGGNELMALLLLCSPKDTAASRHKVTTGVEAGFRELSKWIQANKKWMRSRLDAGSEVRPGKKKPAVRAPGLRSPVAILAALIIEYPSSDSKFRNWISRLEVDWMLDPRETLSVECGIWKGLDRRSLNDIFTPDTKEHITNCDKTMLADYDSLLGGNFLHCRRDIRPFIPRTYGNDLGPLTGEASDIEDISSGPGSSVGDSHEDSAAENHEDDDSEDDGGPAISDEAGAHTVNKDILHLRDCLNAAESIAERVLEAWLVGELMSKDNDIIPEWCRYWEDKIDKVTNYQDQMIIRSLFIHGSRRAKNLYTLDRSLANAFMLVHITDIQDMVLSDANMAVLQKLPLFSACQDANSQLVRAIKEPTRATRDLPEGLIQQQACLLHYFAQDAEFFAHWRSVFTLEAMYSHVVRCGREEPLEFDDLAFLQGNRDALLDEKAVKTLQMTSWQARALLLPGSEVQPLTDWQLRVFRQKFCPELDDAQYVIDLKELRAKPVAHSTTYPDPIREEHGSLYKLFGVVEQPASHAAPPSRPRSIPTATPSWPLSVSTAPPSCPPSVRSSCADASSVGPSQRRQSQELSTQNMSAGHEVRATPHKTSRKAAKHELPKRINGTSQDASPGQYASHTSKAGSLEQTPNRMAGKSHIPNKRALSPRSIPPSPKVPRLGGGIVTRDELTGQLDTLRTELIGEANSRAGEVKSLINNAATSLPQKIKAAQETLQLRLEEKINETQDVLRQDLRTIQDRLQDTLNKATRTWSLATNDLADAMRKDTKDTLAADRDQLQHDFEKLTKGLYKQQHNLFAKLDLQAVVQDALRQQAEAQKLPLKPGQDGYLNQCKAPSGWEQHEYETTLIRAAWLYIYTLGVPDGGVTEDEATWSTVLQSFPGLDEDHILMALDHEHIRAYGYLFNRK